MTKNEAHWHLVQLPHKQNKHAPRTDKLGKVETLGRSAVIEVEVPEERGAEAAALASLCRFFDKADAKLIHKINGLELKNAPDDHGVVAAMALVDVSVRAVGDASLQWCDARALHASGRLAQLLQHT